MARDDSTFDFLPRSSYFWLSPFGVEDEDEDEDDDDDDQSIPKAHETADTRPEPIVLVLVLVLESICSANLPRMTQ